VILKSSLVFLSLPSTPYLQINFVPWDQPPSSVLNQEFNFKLLLLAKQEVIRNEKSYLRRDHFRKQRTSILREITQTGPIPMNSNNSARFIRCLLSFNAFGTFTNILIRGVGIGCTQGTHTTCLAPYCTVYFLL
jgi:hypothetical protein